MAVFPPKLLFWLPKLYHLNFLFSVKRQKAPSGCSIKKAALEYFAKLTGKHLCRSPFFKWSCRPEICNFIKKDFDTDVFLSILLNLRTAVWRKICEIYNYKSFVIWLVETACILLIFLIAAVQISVDCETQESQAGYTKHLNLH